MSSASPKPLQLLLVEDKTGQEFACIEGPGAFSMRTTDEYKILITNIVACDLLWVRIVIASGLVAAKQQRKQRGRGSSKGDDYILGDVIFEQ